MRSKHAAPRTPRYQYWVETINPNLEGKLGTTFSLSNGTLGLRGAHEEMPSWGRPEFYIADTYTGGPPSLLGFHDPDHILTHPARITPTALQQQRPDVISTLPNFPNPACVTLLVGGIPFSFESSKVLSCERLLDTESASLRRCLVFRDRDGRRTRVDSHRFVSFADPHLIALRYRVRPLNHNAPIEIQGQLNRLVKNANGVVLWSEKQSRGQTGLDAIECITDQSRIRVAIAQAYMVQPDEQTGLVLELRAVAGRLDFEDAIAAARRECDRPFAECLDEHVRAYRRERNAAHVEFDAGTATVQGFNFGQMHLHMAFGKDCARVGVPIKGLTGHGYRHVNFWDMDFHMFPYYLMTKPRRARRLLEYRHSQLPAYRDNARRWGAQGAQVPWETQTAGTEETAPWLCLQDREIHIGADAAYMFKLYDDLTPDSDALISMGAEFVLETARFYASRMTWNTDRARYELPDIGCPDQYHTFADNNIFISRMAKWNLEYALSIARDPRHAATLEKIGLAFGELEHWRRIVNAFYIIEPDEHGIIEEFDGYFQLDTDMNGISELYCRHSQAVKQPDVLAVFGPFEDDYAEDIRRRNWHYYATRTLHGSSLSLPGMAYAAARCGLNDEALDNLHASTRMDLDDVNLDSERGVHVSGGALEWYTVVYGFGGLTPRRECLQFNPNLPRQWEFLRFTVHWQFQRLHAALSRDSLRLTADAGNDGHVAVKVGKGDVMVLQPGEHREFT